MGIQLHDGFAAFDVSFPCRGKKKYYFEEIRIDGCDRPRSFPNPVPSGTRVPQWALRDVTVSSYRIYLSPDNHVC